jgi:hypothetical protein
MFEGAAGQRHVAVAIAFAGANVQEHPLAIDVGHLQVQTFTQTQAAGVKSDERNPLVQGGDAAEDLAHLLGREDDGQFESGLSANQFQFRRPDSPQGFLPEQFDRAQGLSGSLAGDFLDALEVNEILAQLLGRDEVWSGVEVFGPVADTGEISLLGSRGDGHELEILSEGF